MRTVRPSVTLIFLVSFLLFVFADSAKAQICSGSLGDPVVNVTFGSGAGSGSPLPGATTKYSFVTNDCPNDGSYTVISSTNSCFGNTWHSLSQDHTPGDNNGYMMLVNASFEHGDFYVDTVRGLCASTTYEFSAWVVNVLLTSSCNGIGIDPNLVFNIETTTGTVLGSYATGNIPESSSPQWKQYGLFFTTPVNTNDVVIRITNNADGGCGNDLALDDITFRPCGPTVSAAIINSTETEVNLCAGSTVPQTISATLGSGYIAPQQQWQESLDGGITWTDIAGSTTDNYTFNKTAIGTYKYRLTVAEGTNIVLSNCRVASNIVTVVIHDFPVVSANSTSPVCESTTLQLNASGGSTFSWTGPAGFTSSEQSPSFIAEANAAGQYSVTVSDQYGCVNNASTTVSVTPKPTAIANADQSSVCEGTSVNLSASGGTTFVWSPADGLSDMNSANTTATPAQTILYIVTVSNGTCSDTAGLNIIIWKKPTASAGEDKVIIKGESVVLNGTAEGSEISYIWSPANFLNDATVLQPVSNVPQDITYTLQVTSNVGCGTAADQVFVRVFNDIYIPTGFSPNGDGKNDTWRIEALAAFPQAVVTVFNRLGNKIFQGSGSNVFWDGTYKGVLQDPGAYVYMLDLKNNRPVKKGWVVIVR